MTSSEAVHESSGDGKGKSILLRAGMDDIQDELSLEVIIRGSFKVGNDDEFAQIYISWHFFLILLLQVVCPEGLSYCKNPH